MLVLDFQPQALESLGHDAVRRRRVRQHGDHAGEPALGFAAQLLGLAEIEEAELGAREPAASQQQEVARVGVRLEQAGPQDLVAVAACRGMWCQLNGQGRVPANSDVQPRTSPR